MFVLGESAKQLLATIEAKTDCSFAHIVNAYIQYYICAFICDYGTGYKIIWTWMNDGNCIKIIIGETDRAAIEPETFIDLILGDKNCPGKLNDLRELARQFNLLMADDFVNKINSIYLEIDLTEQLITIKQQI